MTARIGTLSIDGTPISEADLARIAAEEKLHAEQQQKTVRVVAGCALDADDCRSLLAMLRLDPDTHVAARGRGVPRRPARHRAPRPAAARPRKSCVAD
jgi:hypothetical protein